MPMRPLHAGCLRSQRDRLRAVAALVAKWIELASRSTAPAHILNGDVISVPREPHRMRIDNRRRNVAPIGLAHQQRGPWSLARRIVVIGDKRGSIAQPALNAALEPHPAPAIDEAIVTLRASAQSCTSPQESPRCARQLRSTIARRSPRLPPTDRPARRWAQCLS